MIAPAPLWCKAAAVLEPSAALAGHGPALPGCRAAGLPGCRAMPGGSADRRIGGSADRRIGGSADRRIGGSADRRKPQRKTPSKQNFEGAFLTW